MKEPAARGPLRINVDTLVSILLYSTSDLIVTLTGEKQGYFSERPTQDKRGSNPGCMHDWLYQCAEPPEHDEMIIR